MALIDSPSWVISHVRNCFITGDESGFCEHVLGRDEEWSKLLDDRGPTRRQRGSDAAAAAAATYVQGISPSTSSLPRSSVSSSSLRSSASSTDLGGLLPNSFDIHFDHRRPPDPTPAPTPDDGLSKEGGGGGSGRQTQTQTWPKRPKPDAAQDPSLYDKKPIVSGGGARKQGQVSSLRKLIDLAENMPANPFIDFAQFDGASQPEVPVKMINVFLDMSQGDERKKPFQILVQLTGELTGELVKVSDLIGLVCHRYVLSRRSPPLQNSTPAGFSLFMADEDGEVEEDFAPLDSGEPIQKFGFENLALVEKDPLPDPGPPDPIIITVTNPQRGWCKIQVDNEDLLMRDILKIILAKRRVREGRGLEYCLERTSEKGKPINLDLTLKEVGTLDFVLRRLGSNPDPEPDPDEPPDPPSLPFQQVEDVHRRYKVTIVKKFKANPDVHLEISNDRLEVSPVVAGAVKSLSLEIESVIDAVIIAEKAKATATFATFRIRYESAGGGEVKQMDLKCVSMIAREIVDRINECVNRRIPNRPKQDRKDRRKPT